MGKMLFFFLMLGLVFRTASAKEFDKSKLDNYFDVLESTGRFMGSMAISKNGEIIYTRSVGYIDVEKRIMANENSKYRIGSITKTFTAVLVLKAVEEKKLYLDQTIDRFFPDIENANKITIRLLLYHRSGISDFSIGKDQEWNAKSRTKEEILDIIVKNESVFYPDSKTKYNNSNYFLLTLILESIYNKTYEELLKEYITEPLGLSNTYYGGKINTENNECKSYFYPGKWMSEQEMDMSIPLGAGGIVSTPVDVLKFSNGLFHGKLLKNETLEMMTTEYEGHGMGILPLFLVGRIGYGHTGFIEAFNSIFGRFFENDISFAIVSNANNNVNNIAEVILHAVYNEPYKIPYLEEANVKMNDLKRYSGVYISSESPLKITISKKDRKLLARGIGKFAYRLQATAFDTFIYDQAELIFKFNPENNTLVLKQDGRYLIFSKE